MSYRVNRIGPYPLGNLNKDILSISHANFNSRDASFEQYGAFSLNSSSGVGLTKEHFVFTDATGVDLADGMQVGIGVQITGHAEDIDAKGPNFMYAISGELNFKCADDVLVECVLGRLEGPADDAAQVNINSPIVVPVQASMVGKNVYKFGVNEVVLTLKKDGGSLPSVAEDICACWRIWNENGSVLTLIGMTGNIGIHKWTEDLNFFEPPRT